MVAHCISALPDEGCGLLGAVGDLDELTLLYPTTNAAHSARIYTVDAKEMLRADRDAEERGGQLIGVFHSHTHTDPYPSPTDVTQAPDPSWHYVLVGLRDSAPVVRSYRIEGGVITEEPIRLI